MAPTIGMADNQQERAVPLDRDEYITITTLKIGWNLISSPIEINKTGIYAEYNESIYTFDEAASQNIILSTLFGWDRENQQYILAETLNPGEGYWMYAYVNCTLLEIDMATFGITNQSADYYQFADNNYWGIANGNLAYLNEYGWTHSITALVAKGTSPSLPHVAIASLIKVDNPPPDAPYWELHEAWFLTGTLVAKGELQNVTATLSSPQWMTWEFPHVRLSPGYYIITLYTQNVYVFGNIPMDIDGNPDNTKNQLGVNDDSRIRPPEYEYPPELGNGTYGCFQAMGIAPIDGPIQMLIYCTYAPERAWLILTGSLSFQKTRI